MGESHRMEAWRGHGKRGTIPRTQIKWRESWESVKEAPRQKRCRATASVRREAAAEKKRDRS